jgi:N6-L-threonylcarbamoyladenine synthase
MYVLGIETSCDETSAAIVRDGKDILSNAVASSIGLHKKYGGIVPEIAFRKQLETIVQVTDAAVKDARLGRADIDLISVTHQPGLLGSLLVGISFAKGLSASLGIPCLEVNHLLSHIYASHLACVKIPFPWVALIVSGGHTSLFYAEAFMRIDPIGATCDDACGEVFDKVAKMLGLGYPGGPIIEQRAKNGDPGRIKFNCSKTRHPFDFSFSGIKTAVLYYRNKAVASSAGRSLSAAHIADICASFQDAVVDVLVKKSLSACRLKKTDTLLVGGGVAANNTLRQKLCASAKREGVAVHFPSKALCMDNAAMVAGLGYQLYKGGLRLRKVSVAPKGGLKNADG